MSGREEYQRYLCSPEWWSKRNAVMDRANHKCEKCGVQAAHVHHLTYIRKFNERLDDLIALCEQCHEAIHNPKRVNNTRPSRNCYGEVVKSYVDSQVAQAGLADEYQAARTAVLSAFDANENLNTLSDAQKEVLANLYCLRKAAMKAADDRKGLSQELI